MTVEPPGQGNHIGLRKRPTAPEIRAFAVGKPTPSCFIVYASNAAGPFGRQGGPMHPQSLGKLLRAAECTLPSNRRIWEQPDRDAREAQLRYVSAQAQSFMSQRLPVLSLRLLKQRYVGDPPTKASDPGTDGGATFLTKNDPALEEGWINGDPDEETVRLAVDGLRNWWSCPAVHVERPRGSRARSGTSSGLGR